MPTGNYKKSAERANPACVILLLDQSFSMIDGLAGSSRPKIEVLATAINRFLSDVIAMCDKGEEEPRRRFEIGVIGYTTDRDDPPNAIVGPVLEGANGTLAGREILSVVDLSNDILVIEERKGYDIDDLGNKVEKTVRFPVWYSRPPEDSMGGAPTRAAFAYVREIAQRWAQDHPKSFPPMVIHFTDGESTDGDPTELAEALQSIATEDGELLLFNCHMSSSDADPVAFPTSEGMLMDARAKDLFRISSELPESVRARAEIMNTSCPSGARGMIFNADVTGVFSILGLFSTPLAFGPPYAGALHL